MDIAHFDLSHEGWKCFYILQINTERKDVIKKKKKINAILWKNYVQPDQFHKT